MTGKLKKTMIGLVIVFISVLVGNYMGVLGIFTSDGSDAHKEEITISNKMVNSMENEVLKGRTLMIDYVKRVDTRLEKIQFNSVRDPFTISNEYKQATAPEAQDKTKTKARPSVSVSGIVWDKSNPYAIINGDIFEVGDPFEDYIVHTILDSMIIFSNDIDVFSIEFIQE